MNASVASVIQEGEECIARFALLPLTFYLEEMESDVAVRRTRNVS